MALTRRHPYGLSPFTLNDDTLAALPRPVAASYDALREDRRTRSGIWDAWSPVAANERRHVVDPTNVPRCTINHPHTKPALRAV